MLAAGKTGGLFCLNVSDGSVHWKAPCETFSYATPVVAKFGSTQQWVVVSENQVRGVSADGGKQLWRHQLTEQGLTNVPTPLVVDDSQLIVSGQGVKGTRTLEITRSGDTWSVTEQWFNREVQFFYTDWAKVSKYVVVGCTDKFLTAIDIDTGKTLGRWRGFSDGNVLLANQNRILILGARGRLSILKFNAIGATKSLQLQQQFRLGEGRFWTPISTIGTRLHVAAPNSKPARTWPTAWR